MNEVVLLTELAHRCGNFFDFFAAAFPGRNHVVGLKQRVLGHEFLLLLLLSFPLEVTKFEFKLTCTCSEQPCANSPATAEIQITEKVLLTVNSFCGFWRPAGFAV